MGKRDMCEEYDSDDSPSFRRLRRERVSKGVIAMMMSQCVLNKNGNC